MAGVLVWLCVLTLASGEVLGLHDGNFADETSRGEWAVEFYAVSERASRRKCARSDTFLRRTALVFPLPGSGACVACCSA